MLPLFEMLANAQNGEAIRRVAEQYALSQKQAEEALAALMPAFSAGLKRNVSDPTGLASFLQALSGGHHARYFEDMGRAFSPAGIEEGNGILGHLFGSKDVSRAVAAQAAQMTGIGQEVLKQMLPAVAAAMMGGLYKQSTGQMAGAPSPSGGMTNPLGQLMEQMTAWQNAMTAASKPQPERRTTSPLDNPFGQMMEQMFGNGGRQEGQPGAGFNPMGADNPLGKIFEDMLKGGFGHVQQPGAEPPRSTPEPESPPEKSGNPYGELFGEMLEAGRKSQEQYQRSMESIFDQYLVGMKKRPD
ncbi:DUF937 domain-containing protein [Oricola cellulosilytica]|uniref:DUF937 domain-containing protein n=1 Tax=Oricola cellulosilytica TaxID=1429082 RepID=A0A4R0PIN2_9HYPH|nr:DUF937 domain-containing protein [Oricola cellulosilytica]TCD16603.1 DUF937 domain-containing protein [Oricola cellulosilytica]